MRPSKFYVQLTQEHCEELKKNPNVNPITKRRVTSNETIYSMFYACKQKFGHPIPEKILELHKQEQQEAKQKTKEAEPPKSPPKSDGVKPKPQPTIVKPVKEEVIPITKIELTTSNASDEYIKNIKDAISMAENDTYNLDQLEKDIQNDDFIQKAIQANIEALQYKVKRYTKLASYDWTGGRSKKGMKGGNTEIDSNLNKFIDMMKNQVTIQLTTLKKNPNAIQEKRAALMNILYDPDNGISTIRGKSREGVRIALIKLIYTFIKVPTFFFKGFTNFMITGPAGSGKTKIASVIAHMMQNLGILASNRVIQATKQNLVAQFVGHSGPKTRRLLAKGLEGVVFIDEAYTLTPCPGDANASSNAFSEEAVGEMINFMDKFSGCLVMIVAGYKNKMYDCFLTFNEGMARRFPKTIDLIPYDTDDLYGIFEVFLADSIDIKKTLTKQQRSYMKGIVHALNEAKVFTNQAGDMLNLSKVVGEDAILQGEDYNHDKIKLSFQKFCLSKKVAVSF
jgi:SpoVK/Ycf46/Vps4 family AAA+-type ATPase